MADSTKVSILNFDFPMAVERLPPGAVAALIDKAWDKAKGPVQALARASGAKLNALNAEAAAGDLIALKGKVGFEFYAVKDKSSVGAYWTDGKRAVRMLCEQKLPLDTEELRSVLTALNGWSSGGNKLVSDAELKKFETDFPKKPPVYRTFEELQKKDKNATLAFRSWALRKGGKAGKAYGDVVDTQNLDDKDPARVSALKAINETLKDYYKSF